MPFQFNRKEFGFRPTIASILALGPLIFASQPAIKKHSITEPAAEMKVSNASTLKPFGYDAHDLSSSKIILANYSSKTGAGKERIEILSSGTVHLIRSSNYLAPEDTVSVKLKAAHVLVLLEYLDSEGIMHLEPEYKGPDPMYPAILQIGIVLPSGEKNFYADRQAAPPNFNRMIGAIIVLAGTASPLVFNQKYFYRF